MRSGPTQCRIATLRPRNTIRAAYGAETITCSGLMNWCEGRHALTAFTIASRVAIRNAKPDCETGIQRME